VASGEQIQYHGKVSRNWREQRKRVKPCSGRPSRWAKFVSVFTDEVAQSKVGGDCGFRIPDLTAGVIYVGFLEGAFSCRY
jgi:hypothetical protein